jgi:hypothetical protein
VQPLSPSSCSRFIVLGDAITSGTTGDPGEYFFVGPTTLDLDATLISEWLEPQYGPSSPSVSGSLPRST